MMDETDRAEQYIEIDEVTEFLVDALQPICDVALMKGWWVHLSHFTSFAWQEFDRANIKVQAPKTYRSKDLEVVTGSNRIETLIRRIANKLTRVWPQGLQTCRGTQVAQGGIHTRNCARSSPLKNSALVWLLLRLGLLHVVRVTARIR